jgi:hypothetical protein
MRWEQGERRGGGDVGGGLERRGRGKQLDTRDRMGGVVMGIVGRVRDWFSHR